MFKEDFQKEIKSLLDALKSFKELPIDEITDEKLKKSFEEINKEVFKGIERISKDITILFKEAEWESFNVAFFGETNAGKSTLIEALTKGDGKSIGDGHKDFTKKISKKSLGNINFLDMPGLEGNEQKVVDEIKKAVNKSHVIFYVIGTNKEPEECTLKKVRNFLSNKAKVYSIINVRGKPSTYKFKRQLVDNNIKKLGDRVEKKLKRIFGSHYYGNIKLNGFIGFLAVGKPKRKDFNKDKEKAINVFNDLEKAYQFSNLHELENIIEKLRKNALEEIKISNAYKFLNSLQFMITNILKNKKEFDKEISEVNDVVKKYQQEIENIYLKYKNYILNLCDSILNEMQNKMRKKVYMGIDNERPKNDIQEEVRKVQKTFNKKIKNEIEKSLEDMEVEIKNKIKEFEARLDLYIKLGKFTGEINLKEIIEKLKIDFNYIFKQIKDIGWSVLKFLIVWIENPILAIIVGVLSLIRKIWDWFFSDPEKRKKEAKQKAYENITKVVKDMKKEINKKLESEFLKLNRKIRQPLKLLKKRANNFKEISRHIDEIIRVIKKTQKNISTLLAQEILGERVEFAYIDLSLSSMVVLGINEIPEDKQNILQLKNIKGFLSISEWIYNIEHKVEKEKETIYIKDEFYYRALDIYNLDSDVHKYKVRKWR